MAPRVGSNRYLDGLRISPSLPPELVAGGVGLTLGVVGLGATVWMSHLKEGEHAPDAVLLAGLFAPILVCGVAVRLLFLLASFVRGQRRVYEAEPLLTRERYDEAVLVLRRAVAVARSAVQARALERLGNVAEMRGDFVEAAQIYALGEANVPSLGAVDTWFPSYLRLRASTAASRAFVLAALGRAEDATRALALVDSIPDLDAATRARAALTGALLASRRGDPAAVVRIVDDARPLLLRTLSQPAYLLCVALRAHASGKASGLAERDGAIVTWIQRIAPWLDVASPIVHEVAP